jgi:Right handed beta helix region
VPCRFGGVSQGNRGLRVRAHLGLAALACAVIALAALPGFAAAAEYSTFKVNSLLDTVEQTACETPTETDECTLRGAIDAANATANVGTSIDRITFSEDVFGGAAPASRISIGSPLPTITEAVELFGGETPGRHCTTGWSVQGSGFVLGPCVEVLATGGTSILPVEASNVTVEGIVFDGAQNGIFVEEGATEFTAENDWFGVGLNSGFGAGLSRAGIFLEPGADGASIGGPDAAERNVFSTGGFGLYVDGASFSTAQGNYFGLQPDGTFSSGHTLDVGVRIVDDTRGASVAEAVGNEVGGVLLSQEAASAECDGPCNDFAVGEEGADIDLSGFVGEEISPATGPTPIRGNYLGLSPDGTAAIGRAEDAIYAGSAGAVEPGPGGVIVGGEDPVTEGNYLDKVEEFGIFAQSAAGLEVLGNGFGILFDGAITDRAGQVSVYAESKNLPEGALIAGNAIAPGPTIGVESRFTGSEILENEIVEGQFGIRAKEDDGGVGNVIKGNTLIEAGAAESGAGIMVENNANLIAGNSIAEAPGAGVFVDGEDSSNQSEANVVIGNTITEAGEVGIFFGSNANHNRIGGDNPGEANTIFGSGTALPTEPTFGAITMFGREGRVNEFAANNGSGNVGAFIKVLQNNPNEPLPNRGIQPPSPATVHQSSASGTSEPNATVRIFQKASAEEGELGGLLAVVKADATGSWTATYATQPVGTLIAATQTTEAGTPEAASSVVSAPTAAIADPVAPPEEEKGGGGGTGGGASGSGSSGQKPVPIAAPAPKVPTVKITKGPKKSSSSTTAKFVFKANPAAGATFECKLDAKKWAKCKSPKTYKGLKPGRHTFQVRASVPGAPTSKPAKSKFTVKP